MNKREILDALLERSPVLESSKRETSSSESARMTADEVFIARKAFEKLIKPAVKEAEQDLKEDMQRRYETDTSLSRALRFGGVEVGKVSRRVTSQKIRPKLGLEYVFIDYLKDMGLVDMVPRKGWENRFTVRDGVVFDRETGEVCDFLEQPGEKTTWVVTGCEPDDVLPLMQPMLEGYVKGMLEG